MGTLTRAAALAAAAIIAGAVHSQLQHVVLTSAAPPPVDVTISAPPAKGTPDSGAQPVEPLKVDAPPKVDTPSQATDTSKTPAADTRFITLPSAKALFDKRDGSVIFVDAREQHEFAPSHIQGAMHVPPGTFRGRIPKKVLDNLPYTTLVVYCGGGTCEASENVAAGLTATLGKNAGPMYIFHDGFPAWEKAGYPVERGEKDIFEEDGR